MRIRIAVLAGVLVLALGGAAWWLLQDEQAPVTSSKDIEDPPAPEPEPEPQPEPYYPENMSPPKELKPTPDELEKWERIRRYNDYVRSLQRGEIEEEVDKPRPLPPKVEMAEAAERDKPTAPEAVPQTIEWLRAQQDRSGFWRDGKPLVDGEEPGGSVFVTALAMLAVARRGYTHKAGDMRRAGNMAVLWTRKLQENSGSFVNGGMPFATMQQAAAVMAVCETHWVSGDVVLKVVGTKAVEYLLEIRSEEGAWGWEAQNSPPNITATGWALMALHSAVAAGIDVPQEVFDKAANWVWGLRRANYVAWSDKQSEMDAGTADSRGMADAVFLLALKWGKRDVSSDPSAIAALERLQLKRRIWDGETNDLMEWFFASTAVHELVDDTSEFDAYTKNQLELGVKSGSHAGAETTVNTRHWESTDHWSKEFGPAYTTSMADLVATICTPKSD